MANRTSDDSTSNRSSPSSESGKTENRRDVRTPTFGAVMMAYGAGEHLGFEHVRVMDCSPRGVGLDVTRPLREGVSFLLKLDLKPVAFAVYDVRHCHRTDDHYIVGAEFHGCIGSATSPEPDGREICETICRAEPMQ